MAPTANTRNRINNRLCSNTTTITINNISFTCNNRPPRLPLWRPRVNSMVTLNCIRFTIINNR